ncbi:MAG: phenylalanine--tRNA ligase subunit beta [Atopostipes suicloacalis]|nr:phenylalanine--tRNA ligase subunit beta [Atopostipes suicloacalis]MDN6730990.1 phenylalanine--tRNA ligase subunit beta [Atopostipes suicloacalis]
MLVSFNWLKEYIDLSTIHPNELSEQFTLGGLEVELTVDLSNNMNHLVVGEVLSAEPVEGSEHLKKTEVDIGTEVLPIVCGAPNCETGQKVVVAKVGAVLPGDFEIEATKIMGLESKGMICSLDELGFSDAVIPKHAEDGIYTLNSEAIVGEDARSYIGLDDTIIEFDLTPNRADAMSMRGVAYEAAALLNQTPKFFDPEVVEDPSESIEDYLSVAAEDAEDTLDYKMRLVKDVEIGESPLWMQRKLMHSGIRPIDLVVDVTNYVMLEFGQPLHAFDYEKLDSKEIYVRRAENDEKFTTLDNQERILSENNLVITNGEKPVALAGVMGGANSQITEETSIIAIESAVFKPALTRRTAAALNLRSEASSRFEKGINRSTVQEAADLAAQLIAELGDGKIISGTAEIEGQAVENVHVKTTVEKVNGLIGSELKAEEISFILDRLAFEHSIVAGEIEAVIPPRRWDIKIQEDLIEEIARMYGYNNIPVKLPRTESIAGQRTIEQAVQREISYLLRDYGLQEAISYALTSEEKSKRLAIEPGASVSLRNPLSKERTTLRQNIVTGLIDNAKYNRAHQISDIALYEIGNVFYKNSEEDFREYNHLAALISGKTKKEWFGKREGNDFYTIKGLLESLLSYFDFVENLSYKLASDRMGMHPGRTANVFLGKELIGYLGQVHPKLAKENDLKESFVFEITLDKIIKADKVRTQYQPINPYPTSSRDIALLVDASVSHAQIEEVIFKEAGEYLADVHLFDLYDGENIAADKKSLAYSLSFENTQATLKESEVNQAFENIKEALTERFDLEIR